MIAYLDAKARPKGTKWGARVNDEIRVFVSSDTDIILARHKGRTLAAGLGFSTSDATLIATAISELARNIVFYAGHGEIDIKRLERGGRTGVSVVARDGGPGIRDVDRAMQDGYSTAGRLGRGLPGARRLMDEFEIVSEVGQGTCVTVTKWGVRRESSASTVRVPAAVCFARKDD